MSHTTIDGRTTSAKGLRDENALMRETRDFVADIARGTALSPSFRDGLRVQRVLDAVERSAAASSRWTRVNT